MTCTLREYQKKIKQILGSDIVKTYANFDQLYVYIKQRNVLRNVSILNSNSEFGGFQLVDCFAEDCLQDKKCFFIYYQLLSYVTKQSLFVVTDVQDGEMVQSLTILFENANWFEREIFDMFGIQFYDHPDMRRLLAKNENGFPLRKNAL